MTHHGIGRPHPRVSQVVGAPTFFSVPVQPGVIVAGAENELIKAPLLPGEQCVFEGRQPIAGTEDDPEGMLR